MEDKSLPRHRDVGDLCQWLVVVFESALSFRFTQR